MKRRQLLQKVGTASTIALGATAVAGTAAGRKPMDLDEVTHVTTTVQGERETLSLDEFERRSDTPSLQELRDGTVESCVAPDPGCCRLCDCQNCLCCGCC